MILKSITEVDSWKEHQDSWSCYDGFKIETDEQEIYLLISNEQSCCESWGYLSSSDDFSQYIGKKIVKFEKTDTALKTERFDPLEWLDCGGVVFITFTFEDGGVLQFAAYNAHNGYYGHMVIFRSKELSFDESV